MIVLWNCQNFRYIYRTSHNTWILQGLSHFQHIYGYTVYQGHANPLEGIPPAVKSALTRAYNAQSKSRMVQAADLVPLPGMKKAPKKRIAAMLEPPDDGIGEENGDNLAENEEENSSDTEGPGKIISSKSFIQFAITLATVLQHPF